MTITNGHGPTVQQLVGLLDALADAALELEVALDDAQAVAPALLAAVGLDLRRFVDALDRHAQVIAQAPRRQQRPRPSLRPLMVRDDDG